MIKRLKQLRAELISIQARPGTALLHTTSDSTLLLKERKRRHMWSLTCITCKVHPRLTIFSLYDWHADVLAALHAPPFWQRYDTAVNPERPIARWDHYHLPELQCRLG